ncbi:MAG: ATP-binding protein [Vicinamibacteria bacterium]|jgi:serine/threonine-protein kinase RsbW|nr:ATP-binding protein [Vicinamibacteria bacterium]
MTPQKNTITLEIRSRFELLDTVQVLLTHLSAMAGFDDDTSHFISVAVRESVVNAIKHGNRAEESRRVHLTFVVSLGELEVRVRDQGLGFDPAAVANPLAPENLLKAEGRGIFFMRSFMDEVSYSFPAEGGTMVTMIKRTGSPPVRQAAWQS